MLVLRKRKDGEMVNRINAHRIIPAAGLIGLLAGSACDGEQESLQSVKSGRLAAWPPPVGTIVPDPELSPAELDDLRFIAGERGWTLDEAIAQVGWQEDFDEAVDGIRAAYPEAFSGAVITPEGPHQAWIGFAGEVPSEVRKHPAFLEVDVEFRANLGFALEALHAQLLDVHHGLRNAGFLDVISAYDLEAGAIDVSLGLGPISTSLRDLEPRLPFSARAENVRIQLVESNPAQSEVLSGGAVMTGCTAGFTVQSGLTRGMSTAGHCGTSLSMRNDAGGWQSLTYQNDHQGRWGDFGWHTTSADTFRNFFQYDTGLRREVYRVGRASKGRTLCRFGRTTGRQCDEVRRVDISSGGEDRLVMMKYDEAEGGDSGGPWHYGNTAYGLHEGGQWWWFRWRDVWSQLVYIDDAINVNVVLCQPPRTTCRPGECGTVSIGCGRSIYCGVCGGCTSDRQCSSSTECGSTGGTCNLGTCFCY